MDPLELAMLQEGLSLTADALQKLKQVQNASVAHIANILFEIVTFGSMVVASNNPASITAPAPKQV